MENIQSTVARSHPSLTSNIKPRRAGVPCVRCRQMKVKCNASQKFPAPCSGCEKANERCSVDPSFKRTPKRSSKSSREHEDERVYTVPQFVSSSNVLGGPSLVSEGPSIGSESSAADIFAELRLEKGRFIRFAHEATGIELKPSVVAEMLEEYFNNMHPKFPLLLDPKTVIDSYDKEPLLFWSILTIASKDSEKHAAMNTRLQILSRQLAADIILLGNRSIHLVQALLLLCVWSSPHGSMNKEPLSMYCALAISMARSLGLHRPQHPFAFFAAMSSELETLEVRRSTWLSCFIIDQWHTLRFGVPSSIRIDHSILHTLNDSTDIHGVPATMRIQLHIAVVTSRISAALGECETSTTGLLADPQPFLRVFETEFGIIQDRYADEWTPADEVSFLDARLSLYSYVLYQRASQTPGCIRLGNENELITQSSVTARQLLTVVTTFPEILSKGIFHVFRSASYAVFFLLRLLGTAPSHCIDEASIKNTVRQTFTILKNLSETGSDRRFQCMRVCRIIEHMINEDWNTEVPFTGRAESFMAMNFVADVAARGIIKATQQHSATRTERNREAPVAAGIQANMMPDLDLDFLASDPMEWAMDWQNIDDLLLPDENTHDFL